MDGLQAPVSTNKSSKSRAKYVHSGRAHADAAHDPHPLTWPAMDIEKKGKHDQDTSSTDLRVLY